MKQTVHSKLLFFLLHFTKYFLEILLHQFTVGHYLYL